MFLHDGVVIDAEAGKHKVLIVRVGSGRDLSFEAQVQRRLVPSRNINNRSLHQLQREFRTHPKIASIFEDAAGTEANVARRNTMEGRLESVWVLYRQ